MMKPYDASIVSETYQIIALRDTILNELTTALKTTLGKVITPVEESR